MTGDHSGHTSCKPIEGVTQRSPGMAGPRTWTSHSQPLRIASVAAGPGLGRVGLTFCPGKVQDGMSGRHERDVGLDVHAIRRWGAVAVVTLIEDHEFDLLGVRALGEAVRAAHIEWLHLPITDVSTPTAAFEAKWRERVGEGLRDRLRNGFDVLVHCKGGLGRAGTIACRLLVELGWEPETAIETVREVRPGALETPAQVGFVQKLGAVLEAAPARTDEAIRDRALGALVGLAVGDAVGTTLEFKARDVGPLLTDMIGGGPFCREPGGWTDDTAMAVALATSLAERDGLDEQDLLTRFAAWQDTGAYSCVGVCDDIGITVREALARWRRTGEVHPGATDRNKAGNGSLMRLERDPSGVNRIWIPSRVEA